jgi:hypothetical protein
MTLLHQVGGRDVPRAHGASHGEGVYTSTAAGRAVRGAGCVKLCRALKGTHGQRGDAGVNSWSGGSSCIVFKESGQLLPLIVVHYS